MKAAPRPIIKMPPMTKTHGGNLNSHEGEPGGNVPSPLLTKQAMPAPMRNSIAAYTTLRHGL